MNIERRFFYKLGLLMLWVLLGSLMMLAIWENASARTITEQEPEDPVTIRRLHVQVMPEFDDPRVLVLVQGRLDVDVVETPQPITFYLPRGAQINQMASLEMTDGSTKSHEFDVQLDAEDHRWSRVTYDVESAHFFYEYYYDPFGLESNRTFTFTLRTPLPIADLTVEVQQPHRATDFALHPHAERTRLDDALGFTYGEVPLGALASEETASVRVSYVKSDNEPSLSREELMLMQMGDDVNPEMAEAMQAQSMRAQSMRAQSGEASTGSVGNTILIGSALLLLAGGLVWYRAKTGDPSIPTSEPESLELVETRAFCTQCGSALKPDAHFCHVCGTATVS